MRARRRITEGKQRKSQQNSRRRLRRSRFLETLESRQMLAADTVELLDVVADGPGGGYVAFEPASTSSILSTGPTAPVLQPEGEPQQDLVQFAQDLAAANVIFYGADWCPFCNEQKALFGDGAEYLPFVEVTNANRSLNATGQQAGISRFPTWEFPGQTERPERVLTLQEISTLSGVSIPTGESPQILPIADVQVAQFTPLHVGVDASDPNLGIETEALTISVTSSNPSVVSAEVLQGNRSAVFETDRGRMIVELFEQRAPIPTARFIELAQAGAYDNTEWHRIVGNFVIQAGQVNNTPNLNLDQLVDDFHEELQHGGVGALSYAKSTGDDNGTSEFFLTDGAAPHLDFNHPVFGQLTDGEDVRKSIQRSVTGLQNDQGQVLPTPTIDSVTIIDDVENGVIKLLPQAASGTSLITVTVTDLDGNTSTEEFTVTVVADTQNAPPFLVDEPLLDNADGTPQLSTQVNIPLTIELNAIDVEGDAVTFTAIGGAGVTTDVDGNMLTITPPVDHIGEILVQARVQQTDGQTTPELLTPPQSGLDAQTFTVAVTPVAPAVVSLDSASDTGADDDVTSDTTPRISISGVTDGALVRLRTASGDSLAQGTASGTTVEFDIDVGAFGDGVLELVATQQINGQESPESVPLAVTFDTQAPDMGGDPSPATVQVGDVFEFDAQTAEETAQQHVLYSLSNEPSGMTIDSSTGIITWIPDPIQRGTVTPRITATDLAGNASSIDVEVTADGPTDLAFTLTVTQPNGDPITGDVIVGETIFINVFVEDISDTPTGVSGAFFDLPLPVTWTRQGAAVFGTHFTEMPTDDPNGTGGIDEVGAGTANTIPVTGPSLVASLPVSISDGDTYTLQLDTASTASSRFTAGDVDPFEIFYGSLDVTVVSPFEAVLDQFSVDEDSTDVSLDVTANDTFLSGFSGTFSLTTIDMQPANGSVRIENNQAVYTPNSDFNGGDTFAYVVTDDQQRGTVTGTVSVSVQPVNDTPVAVNDTFTQIAEESVDNVLDLLGNDTDVDGDTLLIQQVLTQPANGSVTLSPNRTFVEYTPNENFAGTDSFTYTVSDNRGGVATGTVSLTVDGVNDPPVAVDDNEVVDEDQSDTFTPLDNDLVIDDGETLSIVNAVATFGNAAVSSGTNVSYTPPDDFNGTDTIVYTISDGNGLTDTGTISISVTPVNDPPTAVDDPSTGDITVIFNTSDNAIDVLANDTDIDGDTLTIETVGGFSNGGSATVSGGQILYTPAAGFTGIETFDYTIEDADNQTSTAKVTVEVLEFVPSSLAGVVFFDNNGDGVQDTGEAGLAGVTITLTGIDDENNAVNESTTTDADGNYAFTEVRAGEYNLTQIQPTYLADGIHTVGSQGGTADEANTFAITLDEGVDGTGNNFAEVGRAPTYRSITDLFRSSSRTNVFAAVNMTTGEVTHWTEGGWIAPDVTVNYDDSTGSLAVNVTDDGQSVSNTVDVNTVSGAAMVGDAGSVRIIRLLSSVIFEQAGINTLGLFGADRVGSEVSQASGGEAEGEGEGATELALLTPTIDAADATGDDVAEGEAFAPLVVDISAPETNLSLLEPAVPSAPATPDPLPTTETPRRLSSFFASRRERREAASLVDEVFAEDTDDLTDLF